MISMKIESKDEKLVVYLYRYHLTIDDIDKLNREIKNIFIKLIKYYHLDFFGYSKVSVYYNKYYGSVLEIEKIYNNEFNREIIDLKLLIYNNTKFFLEFEDYPFSKEMPFVYENNKFYVDLENIDNIYKYIEFGKVIYDK